MTTSTKKRTKEELKKYHEDNDRAKANFKPAFTAILRRIVLPTMPRVQIATGTRFVLGKPGESLKLESFAYHDFIPVSELEEAVDYWNKRMKEAGHDMDLEILSVVEKNQTKYWSWYEQKYIPVDYIGYEIETRAKRVYTNDRGYKPRKVEKLTEKFWIQWGSTCALVHFWIYQYDHRGEEHFNTLVAHNAKAIARELAIFTIHQQVRGVLCRYDGSE